MSKKHSYTITISNNKTEREGRNFLIKSDPSFINLDSKGRKKIMTLLGLNKRYSRSFDLVKIKGHTNKDRTINVSSPLSVTLIELKTTKKKLLNNPSEFFFGATANEFSLAKKMGNRYKFCFVSLHKESRSYAILSLKQLKNRIKRKRIQYNINLE